ncbi:cytidine deaminase [Chloroflexus aggregans]|uniref:Cytidine deaminase n=1 Tax=Chloroflexus aggregans (strain MD-66 / DSM 9485) TaxID=326427 RepID=B8G984_CHLAD|nr:cytidine deaminase [Chloroflexus aggregans]ACL24374.1 cytidine deaminase [Chloroflexus aggregans DSM 9485]
MDPVDLERLIAAALAAQRRAYAPYSQFAVGAAVLTANGHIFSGANIENASYPLTICAERVALFCAHMAAAGPVTALAVVTPTPTVASPCGACRQVIFELAPHAQIVLLNADGSDRRFTTPAELLPYGFGPEQLHER